MDQEDRNLLRKKFDNAAQAYDKDRKAIIPHFDIYYGTLVQLAQVENENPRILDLGAGTGLLTQLLWKKHPQARFQLVDMAPEMLNIAKNRFSGQESFEYINEDYLKYDFDGLFDMIVSSLSIHHLNHSDIKSLYQKAYDHLNPGGLFLNADEVIAPNSHSEETYQENWLEVIQQANLEEDDKAVILERMKFDNPATLEDNINWLKEAGFKDVDVYYKYYNFVVLYGRK
jgi:tRNA (cmo5U34)-methyltransferase